MKINDKLSIGDFGAVTEILVDAYFDENGNYIPHYGLITAMRLFYDHCVIESKFDDVCPRNTADISQLNDVFADEEFIEAFNKCADRSWAYDDVSLSVSFHNAYMCAMEIVEERRSGLNKVLDAVRTFADGLTERIIPLLNEDNLNKLSDAVSGNVEAGSADAALSGILKQYEDIAGEVDKEIDVTKNAKTAKRPAKKKKDTGGEK